MKILFDSTEEKSEVIDLLWRMIMLWRDKGGNRPEFEQTLSKFDHEFVSGCYPESFTDEEYKEVRKLFYDTKR